MIPQEVIQAISLLLYHSKNQHTAEYMRSFYEPYRRNPSNTTVQNLIQSYINVQVCTFTYYPVNRAALM